MGLLSASANPADPDKPRHAAVSGRRQPQRDKGEQRGGEGRTTDSKDWLTTIKDLIKGSVQTRRCGGQTDRRCQVGGGGWLVEKVEIKDPKSVATE